MAADAHRRDMSCGSVVVMLVLCGTAITTVMCETLEVTTIVDMPFYYEKTRSDKTLPVEYTGFCHDLANELSKELDMELSMSLVPDGRYGTFNYDDQTWSGMMGEVVSGKAQVAIAPLTVNLQRSKDVLFTSPFMSSYLAFTAKKPELQSATPDLVIGMMSVFRVEVWIFLFISLILIGIGLWVVAFLIGDEEFCRVEVVINYMVTSLFFLSPVTQPKHTVVRAYTYLWLLFRITLFIVYVVYFVNYSTVEKMEPVILEDFDDVADAAERGDVKVLMVKYGSTQTTFQYSELDTQRKIYNSFLNNEKGASNTMENLQLVREGAENYVFIGEMPPLKFIANQPPCDLYVGHDHNSLQPQRSYAIAVNKENPGLHEDIERVLDQFRMTGFLANLEKKYFGEETCDITTDYMNKPGQYALSVIAARSLFLLVLVLVLYAIAVFIYSKVSGRSEAVREIESENARKFHKENNLGAIEHKA